MQRSKLAPVLATLFVLAALSACAPSEQFKITHPCPTFGILGDAEQATAFNGAGHDLSKVAYRATLSGAALACDYAEKKNRRGATAQTVKGTLTVNLSVERGPALSNTEVTVPYFVAVTRGKKYVLARQEFSQSFNLASGTRAGSEEKVPVSIPVAKELSGANYEVVVGITLTPDQLAYNRAQKAAH